MKRAKTLATLSLALALGACQTTTMRTSDEQANRVFPQTGIEAITGEWVGVWTGGNSQSTLKVNVENEQEIKVRYCYGGWCRKGCVGTMCTSGDRRGLKNVMFENEKLTFTWNDRPFTFEREGELLRGDFSRYTVQMKRK